MRYGHDLLASALYVDMALKVLPKGSNVGILLNSFDRGRKTGWRAIKKYANSGKVDCIKVASIWRDNHQMGAGEIDKAKKDLEKLMKFVARWPHIEWQFNPFLEYQMPKQMARRAFREMLATADGRVDLVNNPMNIVGNGMKEQGVVNEVHHEPFGVQPRYQFSYDGQDAVNAHVRKDKMAHAAQSEFFWFWTPQYNLKKTLNESKPRPLRKPSVITKAFLRSVIYLEKAKAPTKLKKFYVWKSHAEQHSDSPGVFSRDNKPVLLSERRFNSVVIKDSGGKILEKLKPTGRLHDGRYVWRSSKWGFRLGLRAFRRTSTRAVKLVGDGYTIGLIDPGYRENQWKN